MEPVIHLENVRKVYKTAAGDFEALRGIDLNVLPGEYLGIIGKSGAGKTTLINIISGVDRLTSGDVIIEDTRIHELNDARLSLWRGRNLGIIYQSFYLMPTLSLLDNVMLPMDFCGNYEPRRSLRRAAALLDSVGLRDHMYKTPAAISGGQQQRVAIARALANDPPILLTDEPTGRLDSATAETIFAIFDTLVQQGKTILMVTHDRTIRSRFTRVLTMQDGRIVPESVSDDE